MILRQNLKDNHFLAACSLYPGSQDTLYLITLTQLAFIVLYATMGQAGDTHWYLRTPSIITLTQPVLFILSATMGKAGDSLVV